MQQEFASTFRFVLGVACTRIRLNVGVIEVNLVILNSGKCVIEVGKAGPNGFDLGPLQFNASFNLFENLIIVECAAIGSDLGRHIRRYRERSIER